MATDLGGFWIWNRVEVFMIKYSQNYEFTLKYNVFFSAIATLKKGKFTPPPIRSKEKYYK